MTTYAERMRVHMKAKKILGQKQSAEDKLIFMEQCMIEEGDRDVCEALWDEFESYFEE